jgi:hypothetical protein
VAKEEDEITQGKEHKEREWRVTYASLLTNYDPSKVKLIECADNFAESNAMKSQALRAVVGSA